MGLFWLLSICFVSGIKLTALYEKVFRGMKLSINNYHLHHSLYGVVLIAAAGLLHLNQVKTGILLGMITFGLGSILQHTWSEHFVFIERENPGLNRIEGWEKTYETFFTKGIWLSFYVNDRLRDAEADVPAPAAAERPDNSWPG